MGHKRKKEDQNGFIHVAHEALGYLVVGNVGDSSTHEKIEIKVS